jgi:hypothetical protein
VAPPRACSAATPLVRVSISSGSVSGTVEATVVHPRSAPAPIPRRVTIIATAARLPL